MSALKERLKESVYCLLHSAEPGNFDTVTEFLRAVVDDALISTVSFKPELMKLRVGSPVDIYGQLTGNKLGDTQPALRILLGEERLREDVRPAGGIFRRNHPVKREVHRR